MKKFNDYLVVLHNSTKHHKHKKIKFCRSDMAAIRVANILERMYGHHYDRYTATNAWQLDSNGLAIFNY